MMANTIVEFLRTGNLGPLNVGMKKSEVESALGACPTVSRHKHGEHWKYESLQIGFIRDEQNAFVVSSIAIYFSGHVQLPNEIETEGWFPTGETSLAMFAQQLGSHGLQQDFEIVSKPNQHIVMKSGVKVSFIDELLQSMQFSPPRGPKKRQLSVFIDQNDYSIAEAEAVATGKSVTDIVRTWLHRQALETPYYIVVQAYLDVSEGRSADLVIADRSVNSKFLLQCRKQQATQSDAELNRMLLNARKAGQLTGEKAKNTFRISTESLDSFQFWVEIVYAWIRQKKIASIDDVICDPQVGDVFRDACEKLTPHTTELENRWALLGLRKQSGRSQAESSPPDLRSCGELHPDTIDASPACEGVYLLTSRNQAIFACDTMNIRNRLKLHYEIAGQAAFPDWVVMAQAPVQVLLSEMPTSTKADRVSAKASIVRIHDPLLNLGSNT